MKPTSRADEPPAPMPMAEPVSAKEKFIDEQKINIVRSFLKRRATEIRSQLTRK